MFLQNLMGCLAGPAQMPPETGWEQFLATGDADDYCAAEWSDIVHRAKSLGAKVDFMPDRIKLSRGRSEGVFRNYRGGVKLAQRFLDSLQKG